MNNQKIMLTVEGMSCGHCVNRVQKAAASLKGVSSAVLDLQAKSAAVEFDAEQVSVEAIKAAIEDQGYEVK